MNPFPVAALAAAASLAACTYENTVQRPVVTPVPAPAPTVVYQPPAPVVQAPATADVIAAPTPGQIVVTYSGRGGFELAQRKAFAACQQRASGGARLVTDDGTAGRATFDCL